MSKAAVFIIESLTLRDEEENRREGQIISQILNLGGVESKYYYIRTKKELEKMVKEFGKSNFRYLHLSCHGNKDLIKTTLDQIPFSELRDTLKPHLRDKRLFISACHVVNDNLAKTVIPSTKCLSIIGFGKQIDFNDAAIIWASFYHLMFKADPRKMERKEILRTLKNTARTFGVPINYFSISRKSPGFKKKEIPPKTKRKESKQAKILA